MPPIPALRDAKFAHLDKLRAFAALSVVLYHVIEHTHWTAFATEGILVWGRIGWMGVDLFFVLSGFVIYLSGVRLQATWGPDWIRVFIRHRLARIAPLYFLTLLIYLVLIEPAMLFWPWTQLAFQVVTHAVFIHNLFPSAQGAINGVNWSIGVEMQFYCFMILALPWLIRAKSWHILLGLCGVACVWKGAVFWMMPMADSARIWALTTQLPGTLDEFAFGIVACKLAMERGEWLASRRWVLGLIWMGVAGISAWLMLFLFWKTSAYWDSWVAVTFFRLLMGWCGASIILALICFPFSCGTPGRLLSRVMDYLGEISYGIYLWHLPVILSLRSLHLEPGAPFLAATVGATIILASFSFHLLERPWMLRARDDRPLLRS